MLFDLRGRGRRRTVQAIYLSLAILMGGGLVLFGVGSDTQGGLFDAFKDDDGGGGAGTEQIDKQIKTAQQRTVTSPENPVVWANLAKLQFQSAGYDGYDDSRGTYNNDGKKRLRAADVSWQKYLDLDPKKVDDNVAGLMVQAYGDTGLAQYAKAVRAQQIVVDNRTDLPNAQRSNLFAQLAVLAYQAKDTRRGDLAADRAVDLAEQSQKKLVGDQLKQVKTQLSGAAAQGGTGTAAPSG